MPISAKVEPRELRTWMPTGLAPGKLNQFPLVERETFLLDPGGQDYVGDNSYDLKNTGERPE